MLEADAPYWIYRYDRPDVPGRWSKILPLADSPQPQPRYAHQVVYDLPTGAIYMHGGNAGLGGDEDEPASGTEGAESNEGGEKRLDDFWKLEIVRFVWG